MAIGEVTVWKMTEQERLAYIKKHPIKPTKRPRGSSYANTEESFKERLATRWGYSDLRRK